MFFLFSFFFFTFSSRRGRLFRLIVVKRRWAALGSVGLGERKRAVR